jgi:glutathione synthase/RimK-type ligase-like ATP-grasp enzyme
MNPMRKIYLITDYKNKFGSKQKAEPYMGGFDKELLAHRFSELGYQAEYIQFADVNLRSGQFKGQLVNYTSSEDKGFHYKTYIEDIVYGLHLGGAIVLPDYRFLRANNNKVFMEILRELADFSEMQNIKSSGYGTVSELKARALEGRYVIKQAAGAMSQGVILGENKKDLVRKAKRISRTRNIWAELWDLKNKIKHRGFIPDSLYRKKFILQEFIPGLDRDWKVLVYGERYYALERKTRKNDFRASGSGMFKYTRDLPGGLLDFATGIFKAMQVPQLSIDIAYDGESFYLLEFQAVYFGTKTLEYSEYYFYRGAEGWEIREETSELELVHAESMDHYIKQTKL